MYPSAAKGYHYKKPIKKLRMVSEEMDRYSRAPTAHQKAAMAYKAQHSKRRRISLVEKLGKGG